jgi:pyrimidine operon attenuation protein/uracil phosphoribosyltransferase
MTSKLPDAEALLPKLIAELKPRVTPATAMIGLHTGGAWVAERLHPLLGLKEPLGLMDIAFYRDDYAKEGLKHDPKRTRIPFEVEGRDLLLVDDVLYTGRTVRAAMNELFDYGPAAQHRAGGARRPRRPPAADRRAVRGRAHRGARGAGACA